MNIQEIREKFKGYFENTEYLLTALIVVVSLTSFLLGRYSALETKTTELQAGSLIQSKQNVTGTAEENTNSSVSSIPDGVENEGGYVASKSGTKFHLPWCPGATQIKDSNKIYFSSKDEALKAGYTPAANCKGI